MRAMLTIVELQKDVLMPILSFEVTILVDPARSHSQAAQASAAANLVTTGANRKLVKFHKDTYLRCVFQT